MKQIEFLVASGQTLGVWGEWPLLGRGVVRKVNKVNDLCYNQHQGNYMYTNMLKNGVNKAGNIVKPAASLAFSHAWL